MYINFKLFNVFQVEIEEHACDITINADGDQLSDDMHKLIWVEEPGKIIFSFNNNNNFY